MLLSFIVPMLKANNMKFAIKVVKLNNRYSLRVGDKEEAIRVATEWAEKEGLQAQVTIECKRMGQWPRSYLNKDGFSFEPISWTVSPVDIEPSIEPLIVTL
jgi:hypothetical protein